MKIQLSGWSNGNWRDGEGLATESCSDESQRLW